jgi:hypothetical protein
VGVLEKVKLFIRYMNCSKAGILAQGAGSNDYSKGLIFVGADNLQPKNYALTM